MMGFVYSDYTYNNAVSNLLLRPFDKHSATIDSFKLAGLNNEQIDAIMDDKALSATELYRAIMNSGKPSNAAMVLFNKLFPQGAGLDGSAAINLQAVENGCYRALPVIKQANQWSSDNVTVAEAQKRMFTENTSSPFFYGARYAGPPKQR